MTKIKAPSKKNAKSAKITDRKKSRKVTIDDVWKTIDEIGKAQKEAQRIIGDLGNRFVSSIPHSKKNGIINHGTTRSRRLA